MMEEQITSARLDPSTVRAVGAQLLDVAGDQGRPSTTVDSAFEATVSTRPRLRGRANQRPVEKTIHPRLQVR
jgi:hypothetical protein